MQWIVPGQPNPEPGWVITLPGLVVQILRPATHRTLASGGGAVQLAANVTMMCGCPIGEGEPWLPSDFEVAAVIRKAGSAEIARVPLAISATQEPSPSFARPRRGSGPECPKGACVTVTGVLRSS